MSCLHQMDYDLICFNWSFWKFLPKNVKLDRVDKPDIRWKSRSPSEKKNRQ